jgi:hypothetical protein
LLEAFATKTDSFYRFFASAGFLWLGIQHSELHRPLAFGEIAALVCSLAAS